MPFDRFTIEQLAGDLLPNATLEQRIATGFNRNHRTSGEGGIIPEEYRVEYVADRAQTTAIVWMGLTVGCARCHDHKYDPIPQKEFYRLFAYFNQVPDEKGFVWNYGNEDPLVKAPLPEQAQKLAELDRQVAAAQARFDALQPQLRAAQRAWERSAPPAALRDWIPEEGLVFRSGRETTKAAGCDGGASECAWPAGEAAQHFDGKHYLEGDGKIADFDYMQPFTLAAWIQPESANGAIVSHVEDYFEGMGHGVLLVDGKIRVHIIRRWTDLGIRVESAAPVALASAAARGGDVRWRAQSGGRAHLCQRRAGRSEGAVRPEHGADPSSEDAAADRRGRPVCDSPERIEDVSIWKRALGPEEAAVVAGEPTARRAALFPGARGAAPRSGEARDELAALRRERKQFFAQIPSVMVMADSATPRDTFVLKRGAYDAPGDKVTAGVAGGARAAAAGVAE